MVSTYPRVNVSDWVLLKIVSINKEEKPLEGIHSLTLIMGKYMAPMLPSVGGKGMAENLTKNLTISAFQGVTAILAVSIAAAAAGYLPRSNGAYNTANMGSYRRYLPGKEKLMHKNI